MSDNPFSPVIGHRNALTKRQMKQIRKLYNEWAREVRAEAQRLKHVGSLNKAREMTKLYYELRNASRELSAKINNVAVEGANQVKDILVATNKRWLRSLSMSTASQDYILSRRANSAIMRVITGSIYSDGTSLSARVWKIGEMHIQDINNIIARGMMMDLPPEQIARQISKYVNPSVRFPWSGRYTDPITHKVYNFPVRGRKVDYNAMRLVRTTIQHSYQSALVELTKDNPLVTGYLWIAAGDHPCNLCLDRDGTTYSAESIPFDHPNGQCEIEPVIDLRRMID